MYQYFFLRISAKILVKVNISDICYIEAQNQFSKIVTDTATYRTNTALYRVESFLQKDLFCRVNRSFIVSIAKISRIGEDAVIVKETEIYISKNYRDELIAQIKVLG